MPSETTKNNQDAIDALKKLLSDPDPTIRLTAAQTLLRVGGQLTY